MLITLVAPNCWLLVMQRIGMAICKARLRWSDCRTQLLVVGDTATWGGHLHWRLCADHDRRIQLLVTGDAANWNGHLQSQTAVIKLLRCRWRYLSLHLSPGPVGARGWLGPLNLCEANSKGCEASSAAALTWACQSLRSPWSADEHWRCMKLHTGVGDVS